MAHTDGLGGAQDRAKIMRIGYSIESQNTA